MRRGLFLWAEKMACACKAPITVKANLLSGIRHERFDDAQYLVVPVVMLRETVVNGALVTANELQPEAWNGVPVTVQHPTDNGQKVSANSPKILQKFSIGTIFNARMDGDKLCAEAWIDVAKAKKRGFANVLAMLQSGAAMDVSTGYFCKENEIAGQYNGKDYSTAHTDLKPDHLALLPNAEGACNWDDGCGVRANEKGFFMNIKQAFFVLGKALGLNVNEESPMDKKAMVDLLINKKVAQEGERETLMALNEKTLSVMVANAAPPGDGEGHGEPDGDEAAAAAAAKNGAKPAANAKPAAPVVVHAKLSDEDQAALAFARNQFNDHKQSLIKRITANSTMKAEALDKMDVATLTTIANGLPQQFDYSGMAAPLAVNSDADADEVEAMGTTGVVANFAAAAAKGGK